MTDDEREAELFARMDGWTKNVPEGAWPQIHRDCAFLRRRLEETRRKYAEYREITEDGLEDFKQMIGE